MNTMIKVFLILALSAFALAQTKAKCEKDCEARELKKDPNMNEAVLWHICDHECRGFKTEAPVLKETEKECTDACVAEALKKVPKPVEAVVWHQCKWACEAKTTPNTPVLNNSDKECKDICVKKYLQRFPDADPIETIHKCTKLCEPKTNVSVNPAPAPKEECAQPQCYDKCACEQRASGQTVEAVIWHICTWQCDKSLEPVAVAASKNDQQCWDTCQAREYAKVPPPIPSVVY